MLKLHYNTFGEVRKGDQPVTLSAQQSSRGKCEKFCGKITAIVHRPLPQRPIHKSTEHNDHLTGRQSAHFRYSIKAREPDRPSDRSSNLPQPHYKHAVEQNRVLRCKHTTVHLTKLTVRPTCYGTRKFVSSQAATISP